MVGWMAHRSAYTDKMRAELCTEKMTWPARSPDLNPVEKCVGNVEEAHRNLGISTPAIRGKVVQIAQEEWKELLWGRMYEMMGRLQLMQMEREQSIDVWHVVVFHFCPAIVPYAASRIAGPSGSGSKAENREQGTRTVNPRILVQLPRRTTATPSVQGLSTSEGQTGRTEGGRQPSDNPSNQPTYQVSSLEDGMADFAFPRYLHTGLTILSTPDRVH